MELYGNPVNEKEKFDFQNSIDRLMKFFFYIGELLYQQTLERTNPAEFKALLERNGIKYNPKYVRGGWN